ncbi:MAG: glycosyltransferase family 39 protein [Magnetospirillum sp.]|nr:glycosyltransferase family 39 protein [Magnetospirillum sp.]
MERLTGGLRPFALLSLFCLMLYLPGLVSLPPMDRDESRFMQATRQMLDSGDFIRIQFQDEMRAKKPAGAYWLQAASVEALSHPASTQTWPYRLPSLLAAWAAVMLTFAFGRTILGPRPALLGAGLLAASIMTVSEAHQAKTDALLLLCTVVAQFILARFYILGRAREAAGGGSGGGCGSSSGSGGSTPATPSRIKGPGLAEALLFWLIQGIAILVKGPVVPVISLLTIAALGIADRNLRWLNSMKPMLGTVVAAAVATPWFVAISQATGGAFVGEAVKGDLLPKLLGAQESHGGFPGMYLVLAVVLFWPGSLLLAPAATRLWAQRHRFAFRVLLAWALPTWIMFELIPTKLPHYVLPAFPALALMTAALTLEGLEAFHAKAAKIWYGAWTLIGLALAVAVVALPIVFGNGFVLVNAVAATAIVAATVIPAVLAVRGQMVGAALALALTAAATYPAVFQGTLPILDKMFLSRSAAQVVNTIGSDGPVAAAGYSEPSLVFLLGTDTRFTDGAGAADALKANPRALVLVESRQQAAFDARAADIGLKVEVFAILDGFNYSRGKRASLAVLGAMAP